jgi:hypothetical protein
VVQLRERIGNEGFKVRHRSEERYFTRERKLSFVTLLLIVLGKSVKSLQNVLNELSLEGIVPLLSNSGLSQARGHLKYSAFIELNREIIVPFYLANAPQRDQGFRLLACDGSRIRLPEHPSIRERFGSIATCTGADASVTGDYPCGQAYVMHDVLNRIVIDGQLERADSYEVDMAIRGLAYTQDGDLLIFDRNFASYHLIATLTQQRRHFVIRCSSGSFAVAQALFAADQEASRIVTLSVPSAKKKANAQAGLPASVRVRFVAVRLSTGELEVLVTSLLDEALFPTADFKAIYHYRWGIETLFDLIKNRLSLENFSGKTAHAVLQDFHATLFLSGLESLLTQDADQFLQERSRDNRLGQTVNNMVSFHAIKTQVFQLLASHQEPELVVQKLTQLFLRNPTYTRRSRDVPRRKTKLNAALHYQKRIRKHCF